MKNHDIKCESIYFKEVKDGKKKFELRFNDRDYCIGDMVRLHESNNGIKTGSVLDIGPIIYVLSGPAYGLPEGHCIFNW